MADAAPSAAPSDAVVTDPFTAALGELVAEMLSVQDAHGTKSGAAAPAAHQRWGVGNPRHPDYRPAATGPEAGADELSPPPGFDDSKALQVHIGRERPTVGAGAYGLPSMPLPSTMQPEPPARDEALDIVRDASRRQRMQEAGFNPDSRFQDTLGDFAAEAIPQIAYATAPFAGRAVAAAPKIAGAAAAGAAALMPTAAGSQSRAESWQNPSPEQLEVNKDTQRRLQAKGLYGGPIDGVIRPGGPTFEAAKQLMQQEHADRASKIKEMEAQGRSREADAATATANAELEKQKNAAADRVAAEANRGRLDQKMRTADEQRPWYSKAIRDYAGPLGYVVGMGAGYGTASGANKAFDVLAKGRASKGNALLDLAEGGDVHAQVGVANDFARRGGARQQPFLADQEATPPWKPNPNQPSGADLYRPPVARETAGTIAPALLYGGEYYLSGKSLEGARAEEAAARSALNQNANDVNMERYQKAKDNVALWEAAQNFGRIGAPTHTVVAGKKALSATRAMPNVSEWDALRGRLNETLQKRASNQPPATPGPTPSGPGAGPASATAGTATPAQQQIPAPAPPSPSPAAAATPTPPAGQVPASLPESATSSASSSPQRPLPKWAQKAGYSMHPTNPNQVRNPDGQWGTTLDMLKKQPKAQAPAKAEPTPEKMPAKGEQNANDAIVKEPVQIDDMAPMRYRPNGSDRSSDAGGRNRLLGLMG